MSGLLSNITNIAGSVSTAAGALASLGGGFNQSLWQTQLQPASWNGVPFFVKSVRTSLTRKQVIHDYAFSDNIYIEDLGRGDQSVELEGFLIGPNLYTLRNQMDTAYAVPGVGTLVHPSKGKLQASLISLVYGEEVGNVINITLQFILTQNFSFAQLQQKSSVNTQSSVLTNALGLNGTLVGNFFNNAGNLISSAESGVATVVSTVGAYASEINTAVSSATRAVSSMIGIASVVDPSISFGRFLGANSAVGSVITGLNGLTSNSARIASATTILQNNAANATAAVQTSTASLMSLAGSL